MPDDNRFAGLGDRLSDEEREARAAASGADDTSATGGSDDTGATGGADGTGAAGEADDTSAAAGTGAGTGGGAGSDDAAGGPAFAFDETSPKSLYVRAGTLERFEDAEFEVESVLRRDHGVRDLTSREFHDALVQVAAEHVEEIAARIEAERGD